MTRPLKITKQVHFGTAKRVSYPKSPSCPRNPPLISGYLKNPRSSIFSGKKTKGRSSTDTRKPTTIHGNPR